MRSECLDAVSELLGRQLEPEQGDRIEASVKAQTRLLARQDPEDWRAKSYWTRLQEAASPGYLQRMQARAQATYGRTHYWKPDETLPHASPDLVKAVCGNSQVNFAGNE